MLGQERNIKGTGSSQNDAQATNYKDENKTPSARAVVYTLDRCPPVEVKINCQELRFCPDEMWTNSVSILQFNPSSWTAVSALLVMSPSHETTAVVHAEHKLTTLRIRLINPLSRNTPQKINPSNHQSCVASDVSADMQEHGDVLDGNRQISGDSGGDNADSNGSFGETLGATASNVIVSGEQGELDMKQSPVSVVQEYDRKKKLAGDLGNGFVRFNLSPAKVGGNPSHDAPWAVSGAYEGTKKYGSFSSGGYSSGALRKARFLRGRHDWRTCC